ncbi:RidA family protein [Streptomyces sp. 4503]|uniref:RidA family protein n=1 Tax=Streptomyces niphimycinicus TaxID=2842201 RepID=A0ABS6CJL7_9ACTN|nr:Rid family hydrolase [Streptomyces niphimycinicus]MBU3867138.1 RidA family protein [Streptomyces niphimycinicus]
MVSVQAMHDLGVATDSPNSQRFEVEGVDRSHGHLSIAGTVGRRADGTIPDDIEEQAEIAIGLIAEILRLEGFDLSALVDVTSYHVDIHRHLPGFSKIKARLINPLYPTWSLIGVSGLANPGLLVEIRATAAYPAAA